MLLLVAAGCRSADTRRPGRVRVTVSVDWEGLRLRNESLAAMARFHETHPDVPLTHLLNAAYYTRPGADRDQTATLIRKAIAPGDETGLHVHCWKTLVEAAGVPFRREPTFWGRPTRTHKESGDMGYDVELEAYEVSEIRAIVRKAKEILADAGFTISGSFRAGGWAAGPRALEAIRAEGLRVDTSSVDSDWHDEWKELPLKSRLKQLWPDASPTQAPYVINTAAGPILEMPDTGALADYLTAEEMEAHIREAVERLAKDPSRDIFVHIGFHADSAIRYIERVSQAVQAIRTDRELPVVFETLEASARAARSR